MKVSLLRTSLFFTSALVALLFIFTSCDKQEQDSLQPTAEEQREPSAAEKEEFQATMDLINSYGPEVAQAYQAFLEGTELKHYSPLGITTPVDFDWSKYAEIMAHTEIMAQVEVAGLMDAYVSRLPEGTYLTMANVQAISPELIDAITNSSTSASTRSHCTIVHETEWSDCGPCQFAEICWGCCGGGCVQIIYRVEQCRHVSTTCSCYTEHRHVSC